METFMSDLYSYVTTFQPLVYMLVAIALIVVGVMMIIPSSKMKEKAKEAMPYIAVGCGLVLGATTLAQEISEKFVF